MRLFLQVSGFHLLFETDDGMIHDLGDPKSPSLMAASATTRFSSRCSLIGFTNVENHVFACCFRKLILGCCVWLDIEWEIVCQQSTSFSFRQQSSSQLNLYILPIDLCTFDLHNPKSPQDCPTSSFYRRYLYPTSFLISRARSPIRRTQRRTNTANRAWFQDRNSHAVNPCRHFTSSPRQSGNSQSKSNGSGQCPQEH